MLDVQTCRITLQDSMTFELLTERVKSVRDGMSALIGGVLEQHEQDIIEYQRIQLLEGHNSDGNDMHPFYSEDLKPNGYFKSKESAGRYAAWKEGIDYPYTVSRNHDAPNLYITGRFHDELGVKFNADSVEIVPKTSYAGGIMAKYGRNAFGLSMTKWNELFAERNIKDEIIQNFKKQIYGN
jgi:hypothetical protein